MGDGKAVKFKVQGNQNLPPRKRLGGSHLCLFALGSYQTNV
jgi:hypothetical protein